MKVVMLTAMAGAGLDLSYGDVFETDETEAKRLLDYHSAREFDPKLDANKSVKSRSGESEELPDGHFQNEKPKGKKKTARQDTGNQLASEEAGQSAETSEQNQETSDSVSDATEAAEESPSAGESQPRPRRRR